MTNIKKAVSKIEKAKSTSAKPAKTKAVKIAALLSAIKAPNNMAVPMPEETEILTGKISAEERNEMIANTAYFRAERRNFTPGCEVHDWLAAEAEVKNLLR